MNDLEPLNQTKLFSLDKFISEFIKLYENGSLPNKILLSGEKGIGKSTLSLHFINYVLSKDEEFTYNINKFEINKKNRSFKTVLNKSNPNFTLIDIDQEKKKIDINKIRDLISKLNKSSFNNKPRFILIDNIEFLNINSINALLKILEEPNFNVYFILINNNKKILPTLLSRCINFRISLTHEENLHIIKQLMGKELEKLLNKDLINYYQTPGYIYNLIMFAKINNYELVNSNLKDLLKRIINENQYKKDNLSKNIILELIESYFNMINASLSPHIYETYSYFLKRISDTKRFNLDEESLFNEFNEKILNV